MGEPRQNFAMDAIQEFKVSTSTYKAEYGLATGGLVAVVTKSGTNQLHGSGLLFFRDASITAKEFFQTTKPDYRRYQYGGTIGGPIVQGQDALLLRLRGDEGEAVPHGERQRPVAAVRGHVPERADALDLQREGRSSARRRARACSSATAPRTSTGRSSPPAARTTPSASFDFAVPRKSAVLGHTWVMSTRALNDCAVPVRLREVRGVAAVQPRRLGAGRLHGAAAAVHAGLHLPVDHGRRLRQRADGPGVALAVEGRLLVPDAARGAARTSGRSGVDFSYIPFEGDITELAARQLDVPEGHASTTPNDPTTYPDAVHELAADLREHPDQDVRRLPPGRLAGARSGLTFNLGLRYDLQSGSFNEDMPGPARRRFRTSSDATASFPLDVSVVHAAEDRPRRLQQLRAARRHGVGSGEQRRHEHPRRLRDVLRQHADAAELQRADLAAGASRSSSTGRRSPIRSAASRATRSSSTAPPNITVESNDTVNAVRAPVQRRRQPDDRRATSRVTADVSVTNRYSDRDTVDPNLPDQVTQGQAVSAVRARQLLAVDGATTPIARCC